MKRRFLPLMAGCLMAVAVPCAAGPLPVDVILSSRFCLPAARGWTVTRISSADELYRMVGKCRAHLLGVSLPEIPAVDFDRFVVLSVEMGEKPSAGYGIDGKKLSAHEEAGTAVVVLAVMAPAPDAMTAQEVTSPCVLIRLPVGAYRQIRVTDQDGRVLAEIPVPDLQTDTSGGR